MRRSGDSVADAPGTLNGYVLVGGRSSRMGRDKALLPFANVPLAAYVAATVKQIAAKVSLVGPPERYSGLGLSVLPDQYPGFGPVAAIATALAATDTTWNVVVACDLPGITADLLRSILDGTISAGAPCGLAADPDGTQQPLCGIYHAGTRAVFEGAVESGEHRLSRVVRTLKPYVLHVKDFGPLRNVNTPEEWDAVVNR